ncbi:MAG: glycosyltransferase [Rhodocyclaceae bacterium]
MPDISVIVPTYNHEDFVGEAIQSVLHQAGVDLELIVIDDASSDESWNRIQSIRDPRLRTCRHHTNLGAHATLNEGLGLARAPVVAILNSDDVFLPGRLASALEVLRRQTHVAAVFTHYQIIDRHSCIIETAECLEDRKPPDPDPAGGVADADRRTLPLCARNYLHTTSNLVCRTDVMRALGGFADYRYVHDHDFFLRLSARHDWVLLPDRLLAYRQHGHNTLSESAVRSVSETIAMLVRFIATGGIACLQDDDSEAARSALTYLARHFSLYGGERWGLLLALSLLAHQNERLNPAMLDADLSRLGNWQEVAAPALAFGLEQEQQINHLRWQGRQMDRLLARASAEHMDAAGLLDKLENDLCWQKEQTTYWWQRYQKCRWLGVPYALKGIAGLFARPSN